MAYDIGPRIGVEGEAEFRKAITQINQTVKTLGTEMAAVTSAYSKNDKSAENLTAQNKVLTKQIAEQSKKLEEQKKFVADHADELKKDETAAAQWQQTINQTTATLNKMERQLRENNEALKGQSISLNDVKDALSKFGQGVSSALSTAAKGIAAFSAAAAAAAGAVGKMVVDAAYAADDLNTLSKQTGLSTEELQKFQFATEQIDVPLDTLTGSMAKLTKNMATASKGTGDAHKAFQALGVEITNQDGTLRDRNEVFNEAIDALAAMENETQRDAYAMQIFGKSAQDLNPLILGGADALKELGDQAEAAGLILSQDALDQLNLVSDAVDTFKASATGAGRLFSVSFAEPIAEGINKATEYIQRLTTAFSTDGIKGAAKEAGNITEDLVGGLTEGLPKIIEFGTNIVTSLASGIMTMLPSLASAAGDAIKTIGTSLSQAAPELISQGAEVLAFLYDGILTGLPELTEAAVTIMSNLGQYLQENLPSLLQAGLEAVVELTGSIRENAGLLVDGALSLAKSLAQGLADAIPTIVENVPTIVSNIANTINDNAPKVLKAAVDLIGTLVKGLIDSVPTIIENMPKIIAAIWDTITAVNWINLGTKVITGLGDGIKNMIGFIKESIGSIKDSILHPIKELPKAMLDIGKNIIQGLIDGIKSLASSVKDSVVSVVNNAVHGVKDFLGIHSPSTVFAGIGENMAAGVGVGFGDEIGAVQRSIDSSMASLIPDAPAMTAAAPAAGFGSMGSSASYPDMVAAFREAMSGMSVYLNGRRVGTMIATQQNQDARAAVGTAGV